VIILFNISGCATQIPSSKKFDLSNQDKLIQALKNSPPMLECTGFACNAEFAKNAARFRMLYDSEQWDKLAREIIENNRANNLSYFYLARSSESFGLINTAKTYYSIN
jgi:hypothetical protein